MLRHSTTIRFHSIPLEKAHQPSPSLTRHFSKVCVVCQTWHCAWPWVTNPWPFHRFHDAAILCAKHCPPMTSSRTMFDCSHFTHTLIPGGRSFVSLTFTHFSAKCHPQAVLHESRLSPHAARVTTWAVLLHLFVEIAHRFPTSGDFAFSSGPDSTPRSFPWPISSGLLFTSSSLSTARSRTLPPRSPLLLMSRASFRNGSLSAFFSKSFLIATLPQYSATPPTTSTSPGSSLRLHPFHIWCST